MTTVTFAAPLQTDLGEGIFTSTALAGLSGGILPSNSYVVATATIVEKTTCAFCENLLQHGGPKMGDNKQLEDIALEHFVRRILGAEEESLGDASEIFPDDLDGTRYRRLLSSVKLCEGCISHFAKSEERVLKDKLEYIGKMSGLRDYSEVLQDPWLDLKRLANAKLKIQEGTIKEKLQLMSRMLSSNPNAVFSTPSSSFARGIQSGNGPSTSTPLVAATTTTTHHLVVTSVANLPVTSICPTTGVVSMDISEVMNINQEQEQQQSATCQFAVASDKGSVSSSCAASPNHDQSKEMENSQDSTQTRLDQKVNDFINVRPDRNQGDSQEDESKTDDREPKVVDVDEDQESSNTPDNQDKHKNSNDSDADSDENVDESMNDITDQQEDQSQVHKPETKNLKQATGVETKNKKVPITTQEMLDVLETSDKEEEEGDDDDEEAETEERAESGRGTPDVQCQKVVVCLDKLDPSKTPVKGTPVKNNPVLKTPPKNKPPADTPSKTKTPVVVPSKSKTRSETPSKSKPMSETPSKSKPSESACTSSATKSLSRKSSSAMPLSKKTSATRTPSKDSTSIKTSSKNTSEKTSMNPPPAKTSNSKHLRRGSVTSTPSDDEGTSSAKNKGKKRPLSVAEGSERMFGTKKLKDMIRSSPRESFTPPESKKGKDKKKVFKIGNRYLTESSSSDDNDSDKDSDVHFTDCSAANADSDS